MLLAGLAFTCKNDETVLPPIESVDTQRIADPPFGINQPNWALAPRDKQTEMYRNVQDAGFGWIRLYLPWNEIEIEPGVYDWGIYGDVIELAHDMGFSVLAVLSAPTPCWAARADCSPCAEVPQNPSHGCLPKNDKVFRSFAAAAVRELGGAVEAWGLWQEPNYLASFPGVKDAPREYQELVLGPGFDGVKDAFATAKVTAPGFIIAADGKGCQEVSFWVNKPGTRDLVRPLDAITVHVYGTSNGVINAVDCIDRELQGRWGATQIWLEEFGFGDYGTTCAQPLEESGLAAAKVLDRAHMRGVKAFLWDLIGDDTGPGHDCAFGLYDNGGNLRTTKFCTIKKLLYEKAGRRMRVADPCFSTKFSMDWLHRFGDVRGRPPVSGLFRALGREEIFVIDPGDRSSWVGEVSDERLHFTKVADGREDIEAKGPMWAGSFTGAGRQEVVIFNPDERSWLLGTFNGNRVEYTRVAHTGHLGGVEDGAQFWTGRFSGSERHELLFWSPKDQNYRLGRVDGRELTFTVVGNGVGGDKVLVNDFTAADRSQILLWSLDDNLRLGTLEGGALAWKPAGSTRGFEHEDPRYIWTGELDGGRGQALFRVPDPSNPNQAAWWLGEWNDDLGKMRFIRLGTPWDHRLGFVAIGDFEGTREDRFLIWVPRSNDYHLGKQNVATLELTRAGTSPPLSTDDGKDLLVWTGGFDADPVRARILVWDATTGTWWLAGLGDDKQMRTVLVANTGSTR